MEPATFRLVAQCLNQLRSRYMCLSENTASNIARYSVIVREGDDAFNKTFASILQLGSPVVLYFDILRNSL